MLDQRAEYAFHAHEAFWTQMGGGVNKQFFSTHGPRHGREKVSQLIDSDKVLQTNHDVVMHIASDFYASLLSVEATSHATDDARVSIWQSIPMLVNSDMHGSLDAPFTPTQEFMTALLALHKGKCPGSDGLTPSFLISLWARAWKQKGEKEG